MHQNKLKRETILLHAGYRPDQFRGAQAVPIVQTTSFRFRDSAHAAALFSMEEKGDVYSRIMNPTNEVLEERITQLEGGKAGALALASGQAAISASILTLAGAGDEIIASRSLYGGTHNLFAHQFRKLGIRVRFVSLNEEGVIGKNINRKTKAVYTETISNPSLEIADISRIAGEAHEAGLPLIVDNTVSPYIFRPFDHGADIIVYSATKYLGGHGNSMGGLLIDSGKFQWDPGRFPLVAGPDPEFHGTDFVEKFRESGNAGYIAKARSGVLRDLGGCLSPFNSFLILQGMETLHLRMRAHLENAQLIVEFLRGHECTEWVNYPGAGRSENDRRGLKYFPRGAGAIIGFGVKGGVEKGRQFIDSLRLISHLANIGDSRTLAIHPASTTHSRMTPEERGEAGVTEDYIRLSLGIENPEDIMEDLDQALRRSAGRGGERI